MRFSIEVSTGLTEVAEVVATEGRLPAFPSHQ